MVAAAPSSTNACRVLIVEDHALFAESLQLALGLASHEVARLTAAAHVSPADLASAITRARPRTVLLGLNLGGFGESTQVIVPLARAGIDVVVLTASDDRARWGECVRKGARKVLSKGRPLADILTTVRRLHLGQPVMTPVEREELLKQWQEDRARHDGDRQGLQRLSHRERVVLGNLMRGNSVRNIASTSGVSEATVRTQVTSILAKLGVSSQLAAVSLAHHVDWHPPEP